MKKTVLWIVGYIVLFCTGYLAGQGMVRIAENYLDK